MIVVKLTAFKMMVPLLLCSVLLLTLFSQPGTVTSHLQIPECLYFCLCIKVMGPICDADKLFGKLANARVIVSRQYFTIILYYMYARASREIGDLSGLTS